MLDSKLFTAMKKVLYLYNGILTTGVLSVIAVKDDISFMPLTDMQIITRGYVTLARHYSCIMCLCYHSELGVSHIYVIIHTCLC